MSKEGHPHKEDAIRAVSSASSSRPVHHAESARQGHPTEAGSNGEVKKADGPSSTGKGAGTGEAGRGRDEQRGPESRPASWKTSDGFSSSAELKDESSRGKSGVGSFLASFLQRLTKEPGLASGDARARGGEAPGGQERGPRADGAGSRKGLDIPEGIRGERREDIDSWYEGLGSHDQRYYQKYLEKTDPSDRAKALTLFQKVDDGNVSDGADKDRLRTRVLDEAMGMPEREARFINRIVLTDETHKDQALRDSGYQGTERREGLSGAASYNSDNNTVLFSTEVLDGSRAVQRETVAHELSHPKEDYNLSINAGGRNGKEIAYGVGIKEAYNAVSGSRDDRRAARESLASLYEARGDTRSAARDKAQHALENPEEYYASVRSLYLGSDREKQALATSNPQMAAFLRREQEGRLPSNDEFVGHLGKYGKEFGLSDARVSQLSRLSPTDARERLLAQSGARGQYRDGVQMSATGRSSLLTDDPRGVDGAKDGEKPRAVEPASTSTGTTGAGSTGSGSGPGTGSTGTGSTGGSGTTGAGPEPTPVGGGGTTSRPPESGGSDGTAAGGAGAQPAQPTYYTQPTSTTSAQAGSYGDVFMQGPFDMGMSGMTLMGQADLTSFLQGNLTLLGMLGEIQLNPDGSVPADMMSRLQQVADQQGVKLPSDLSAQDVGKAVQAAVQPAPPKQGPAPPPPSGPVDFSEKVVLPGAKPQAAATAPPSPSPRPLGPPMPRQQMMASVSGVYQNLTTSGARPDDLRTLAQAAQTREGAVYVSDALETMVTASGGGAKMTALLDQASASPDGSRAFAQTLSSMAEANPARAVGLMLLTTDAGGAPQIANLFQKMGDDPAAATHFASFFEHATRTPDGARGMGELIDTVTAPAADGDRSGVKQVSQAFKQSTDWVQGSRDVTQGFVNTLESEGGSRAFARTMHRLTSTVESSATTGQTLKNMSFDRQGTDAVSQLMTRASTSRDGARQVLDAFNRIADSGDKGKQDVSLLLNRVADTGSGGKLFANLVSDKYNADAFNTLLNKLERNEVNRELTAGALEKVATRAALPDANRFQKAVSSHEALSQTLDRLSWRPAGDMGRAPEPLRLQPSGYAAMQATPPGRPLDDAAPAAISAAPGPASAGAAVPGPAAPGPAVTGPALFSAPPTVKLTDYTPPAPTTFVAPPTARLTGNASAPIGSSSLFAAPPTARLTDYAPPAAPAGPAPFSAPPTAKLTDYVPPAASLSAALSGPAFSAPPTAKLTDNASPAAPAGPAFSAPPTAKLTDPAPPPAPSGPAAFSAPPTAKLPESPASSPHASTGHLGPVRLSGPARVRSTDPRTRDADAPRADHPAAAASTHAVAPTASTHTPRSLHGSPPPAPAQREQEPLRLFSFRPGDVYSEDTLRQARICPDCGFRLTSGGTCVRCSEYARRELLLEQVKTIRPPQDL